MNSYAILPFSSIITFIPYVTCTNFPVSVSTRVNKTMFLISTSIKTEETALVYYLLILSSMYILNK